MADIVQPPPELETAVEAVLGERLGNIIVESHEVGVEAIEFLKSQSEGRSSFIPLTLRGADVVGRRVVYDASGGVERREPVPVPGGLAQRRRACAGPMLELIGYDRQYDRVAAYLLGDVLVVEDLRRALELWRETRTDKTIVTLDGEVIDPQRRGHRRLARVARWPACSARSARSASSRRSWRASTPTYEAALERHVAPSSSWRRSAPSSRRSSRRSGATRWTGSATRRTSTGPAARREQHWRQRRNQLAASAASRRPSADARTSALERRRARRWTRERRRRGEAEALRPGCAAETEALAERVDALVAELTTLKIAASQADERRAHGARDAGAPARASATEQESRRGAAGDVRRPRTRARAETLRADADRLREEAALWPGRGRGARARSTAERAGRRRGAQRRCCRAARPICARLATSVNRLAQRAGARCSCAARRRGLRRSSLEEQVADRYRDVRLAEVVYDYHLRPPAGDEEEARMKELRGLIERMGEINLTAIEESEELQKRFDFLTAQKADLESAIGQLETAIEKINQASRKLVPRGLRRGQRQVPGGLPALFGGGKAQPAADRRRATCSRPASRSSPSRPGKKIMQNIELLSGGEKALTAVSLIFAIFLIKPSPFCVLDEVDAPLDEANVGRFNQLVREMTDRSQFILITHNRRTMEIADRLYGVTMEEPGVSKLVAVNLRSSRKDGGRRHRAPPRPAAASRQTAQSARRGTARLS